MLEQKQKEIKDPSNGVPVPVEGEREVMLVRRGGRLRLVAVALWLALPLAAGCGGGSAEVEEGTTVARCADEQPVVQQAPGGVVIGYCGAIRYVPAAQLAAPVAAQIQQSMVRR